MKKVKLSSSRNLMIFPFSVWSFFN